MTKSLLDNSIFETKPNNYAVSNMIRDIWGEEPIYFDRFINALTDLPVKQYMILCNIYNLPFDFSETDIDIQKQNEAIQAFKEQNETFHFLVSTEINYLSEKLKSATELKNKILESNNFCIDWEIKFSATNLSARIKNALFHKGIYTINDLVNYGLEKKKILLIRNIGKDSIAELEEFLKKFALEIKE